MSELSTAATNILNRLVAAPTYHPGNADLFTDWNLQAGDVVTVAADGENYSVPIYNMKLKWTGQSKVEVESTGNPKREPPPAVNRKSYGSAAGGYGGQKQLSDTLHDAGLFVDPETGVWAYASEQGEDYALGATFSVQSTAINLKVSKGNVATQLSVECGNVHVSGGNLTVDGYILASELESAIATIGQVQMLDMYSATGTIDNLTVGDLRVNDTASFGTVTVNGTDLESNAVSSIGPATVDSQTGGVSIPWSFLDGNSGQPITFNIASTVYFQQAVAAAASGVTVSGSWATNLFTATASNGNGAVGSFTVGDITSTTVNPNDGHYLTGTVPVTLTGGGSTSYSPTVNINATPSYSAGNAAGIITGQNNVVINKGGWDTSNKKVEFTKSVGTASTKNVVLSGRVGTYDSTNNKYVVSIYDDGTRWTGLDVDVVTTDAFSAGYSAGWAAARALISTSSNKIYGPPATVDGAAETMYTITTSVTSGNIYWQATKTARCDMTSYAYINGNSVRSASRSQVNSLA